MGNKIILQEVISRGFLSNYTTILTSFRGFITKENLSPDDILISSSMFSLYGNPKNWFDSNKVREDYVDGDINISSTKYYDFDPWPTKEQLNLKQYIKYFPYNERICEYLNYNLKDIKNGFGIHFRGTDHSYHVDEVPLETYFESIKQNFSTDKYDTVFLCSDEEYVISEFEKFFKGEFNFDNIVVNDVTRSFSKTPLHLSDYDPIIKIKLGDEVLLDSHSLSLCDIVIGKTSNLISYARILNPRLNFLYQDRDYSFRR